MIRETKRYLMLEKTYLGFTIAITFLLFLLCGVYSIVMIPSDFRKGMYPVVEDIGRNSNNNTLEINNLKNRIYRL